ncbi:MAG: hypothetical protein MZU84_05365 [Sphingobacterium sp.]|nr:hypothetical protein [Sphingobacterium sp.]
MRDWIAARSVISTCSAGLHCRCCWGWPDCWSDWTGLGLTLPWLGAAAVLYALLVWRLSNRRCWPAVDRGGWRG